ncbi:hypothetical protein SAMN05421827_109141 [Pedobacter terrae]|uniref:Uncharacterized protein n=1 Tax=Pedobacter terrae TaxID=405671 RepID=A0A1G7W800_9SPHI|nr:DUF6712 family protein [Pedobacter terrae]SDG68114.1 hypothetical protein SAMN05421827_109141 [Pedobacter terrae]
MKLVSKIKEIQDQVPVSMTQNIELLKPYLSTAERQFIRFMIGKEQFDAFASAYEAAGKDTSAITDPQIREAIELCQKIEANLAYLIGLPVLSVTIGASGIQILSNDNTKNAFQWQVDKVEKSLLELGFDAIEELLEFLEYNADIFPEYINSKEFSKVERCLIETAADFDDQYNIRRSRYAFQVMVPIMYRIENQILIPLFGKAFMEILRMDNLDGKTLELVESYLKPGIALLTIAKASVERIITIDNGMASVNLSSNYETIKDNSAIYNTAIQAAAEQLTKDGNEFIQDGLQFLLANIDSIDGYEPQPLKRGRFKRTNDPEKGIYTL